MEIPQIGSRLMAAVKGQRSASESNKSAAPALIGDAEPAATDTSPLGEILADYDLNRITPREFSQLVDRLKDADILTPREQQQLAQLRLELDTNGVSPDEPVDLIDHITRKVAELRHELGGAKTAGDDAQAAAIEATLNITLEQSKWLDKLQTAQRERPLAGVNASV